jgi:hypothetical protein
MPVDLSSTYVLFTTTSTKGTWDLDDYEAPEGVQSFEHTNSAPLLARWGQGATGTLRNGDRKKPRLADAVLTTMLGTIVSDRLRQAIVDFGATDVEFLPIKLTLEGAPVELPYFLLHPTDWPDCLDREASGATMSEWVAGSIDEVQRLAFTSDPGRALFKPLGYHDALIASLALAEALARLPLSGIRWMPLDCHPNYQAEAEKTPFGLHVRALYEHHALRGTTHDIPGLAAPAKVKRASAAKVKAWLASAPGSGTYTSEAGATTAFVAGEDETWRDAYDDAPDDWPGFEPKRYRAFGSDGQSNHYLIDLDADGAIVYLSHETGFGQIPVVAPSMAAFAARVAAAR